MYCRKCGKPIDEASLFCPYCGTKKENDLSISGQKQQRNDGLMQSFSNYQEIEHEKELARNYAKALSLMSMDKGSIDDRLTRKYDAYDLLVQLDGYKDCGKRADLLKADIKALENEAKQKNRRIYFMLFKILLIGCSPVLLLWLISKILNLGG